MKDNEDMDAYVPLLTDANETESTNSVQVVTPFAKACLLSKYTFWWLNLLMKKGRERILEEEDVPRLGEDDQAKSCYVQFTDIFNRIKQSDPSSDPSILRTILICHWKEIFVSGLFAVLKIVTMSSGPLLLKAFIKVADGEESFRHEKYVLVVTLLVTKIMESVSQRQWFFRVRLIGLEVRSLLISAIYQKQLRLSNAGKAVHSSGEIINCATVDAYRVGEFPYWFHQMWTMILQLCIAIIILFQSVGLATVASMAVIILTVICNAPIAKLQHEFQMKLTVARDRRLKANMKVLKLYAWETHFRRVIENLRASKDKWLSAIQKHKAYDIFLFWFSPILVSAATFGACYLLGVERSSGNAFTFIATLHLIQGPVRAIPDVITVFIQANVAFTRILRFLQAPEIKNEKMEDSCIDVISGSVSFESADLSWNENPSKPTLRNISLTVKPGSKTAICGEVGSGKSTLLAAILGEVPVTDVNVKVHGTVAYVSQSAWIQSGSIQENILFGSAMDDKRYQDTLHRCYLVKDLELLPYGNLTEIGERGITLSGGQKQRVQLARALYKNADVYLLDDPFSAVDAHTATSLLNDYVMGALAGKTVLLVTHQVDFLPALDSVLLLSDGNILHVAQDSELLASCQEFRDLVSEHRGTAGVEILSEVTVAERHEAFSREICKPSAENKAELSEVQQLVKKEEKEVGDTAYSWLLSSQVYYEPITPLYSRSMRCSECCFQVIVR